MAIVIKTEQDIEGMRLAGRLAAEVLDFIAEHIRPGVSTAELDRLCHGYMVDVQGTTPAPLHYSPPGYPPYPKSICTSVNSVICHGIPKKFHEEPQVLHYGKAGTLDRLQTGMTFTIEPMINAGRREIKEMPDGWTIVTKDHSLSAQWEHTVLVTPTGHDVLTVSAHTPPPPAWIADPTARPRAASLAAA